MASDCTDIDIVLRQINQRLRKLEKSDSEKTEEIGRLNRVINQKDVEIHNLKTELAVAKERIKELEEAADDTSSTPGKPEKNSSNSSIPPSQESIASREQRRTKSLRKPSGKPSGGQPGHKGHTLQTIAEPDVIVKHEPVYCKCCGRLLIDIPCQKIRKTQIVDIKVVVETCEEQYYEKVCECGCVNNCEAPNCRIKYGDNLRALVTYLNVVQCIPFKRIAELISDLSGQNISEGTVQNILKENSGKADSAYEEIRKRLETASVVGADETGAAVGKHLHWNWIFQNDLLTYVFQSESRGQKAIDSKFPKGLPYSTLVTDRHQSYFKMNVKAHQVCLAHLLRNAEYLNELDSNQDWSRRFIQLIEHSINLRREGNITSRKIKVLKTKMKNLLGESLTHLDNEFEKFKRGILKVKDYLFTFLSNPSVPYDNNASERGVRKIKIKQKVSGCFRTDAACLHFVDESKYDMPSMVPHTSSTSGMLSDLIVNRFQYAITSGREMYRMVNEKMRMSKSTIFNWLRHGAEFLENCQETIKQWLLKPGSTIYCDESWVDTKVTDANGEVHYKKRYMWVIVNLTTKVCYYLYGSRKKEVIKEFLGDFKGTLMTDAYAAYLYFNKLKDCTMRNKNNNGSTGFLQGILFFWKKLIGVTTCNIVVTLYW